MNIEFLLIKSFIYLFIEERWRWTQRKPQLEIYKNTHL